MNTQDNDTRTYNNNDVAATIIVVTAKQFADLVASNEVAPEVQAQLRYYLAKLAKSYQQESMLGSASVGNSAFKQYLSEQISLFLENGEWPANFKVLPMYEALQL